MRRSPARSIPAIPTSPTPESAPARPAFEGRLQRAMGRHHLGGRDRRHDRRGWRRDRHRRASRMGRGRRRPAPEQQRPHRRLAHLVHPARRAARRVVRGTPRARPRRRRHQPGVRQADRQASLSARRSTTRPDGRSSTRSSFQTLLGGGGCGLDVVDLADRPVRTRNTVCATNLLWRPVGAVLRRPRVPRRGDQVRHGSDGPRASAQPRARL